MVWRGCVCREWAATVEWVGSEGQVEKVRKEDWWKAEEGRRLNKAARPAQMAAERAAAKPVATEKTAAERLPGPTTEGGQTGLGSAVPVAAPANAPHAAAPVKASAATAEAAYRRSSVDTRANLLTRKNRQNITYQLRLGTSTVQYSTANYSLCSQ